MDTDQIAAIAAAVAQAIQQGQNQDAQQAIQQQPPPGAFALTPGRHEPNTPLDYSTRTGQAQYNAATASLPHKFDVTSADVHQFCEDLRDRADEAGWGEGAADILTIPDGDGNDRNLISNYGQLTSENIETHVDTYIGNQTRQAQNAIQMYHCITSSLSESGKKKMLAETSKYKVQNELVGPLIFKLTMQKAIVDTRATASFLRSKAVYPSGLLVPTLVSTSDHHHATPVLYRWSSVSPPDVYPRSFTFNMMISLKQFDHPLEIRRHIPFGTI